MVVCSIIVNEGLSIVHNALGHLPWYCDSNASYPSLNPMNGIMLWTKGLQQLIDILKVLHSNGELEPETMNAASKACSECWMVAEGWEDLGGGKAGVSRAAAQLKGLSDENDTFRGEKVYRGVFK